MKHYYRKFTFLVLGIILVFTGFTVSADAMLPVAASGAGSSAVGLLLNKWTNTYWQQKKIKIQYQATGSSVGIKLLQANKVDFAISDKPLDTKILSARHWEQVPIALSQIDIVYNLPNLAKPLVLDGRVIAQIYLGQIKKWNAAPLQRLNPDVTLPDRNITLVYRGNDAGTTYTLFSYLSQVYAQWKAHYKNSFAINKLPTNIIKANTSEMMTNTVDKVSYSIGYVDDSDAKNHQLSRAVLVNREGKALLPQQGYTFSALSKVQNSTFSKVKSLTNLHGKSSWPIIQISFVLFPKKQKKSAQTVTQFFYWALETQKRATFRTGYIPLPPRLLNTFLYKLA